MTNATTFPGWAARTLFGLLSLAMLAFVAPATAQAQEEQGGLEECAGGTLFYLTLPDTTDNTQDSRFTSGRLGDPEDFVLLVYSPVDQTVRIGRSGSSGQPVSITQNEVIEYDLRALSVPMNTIRNTDSRDVIKIEAEFPVVVYAYMSNHFGVSAYTAMPVESWGQEYYASTWPGWYVRNVYPAGETDYNAEEKKAAPAEIIILAAYDDTQVTIRPTGPLVDCNGCGSVVLDAGQSYMVQSFVDTNDQVENQPDIAGTFIQANKRIGVITGNTRTQLEDFNAPTLAGNSAKDQVIEMLAPLEQHGTEFVFMPTYDQLRQRGVDFEKERNSEFVRVYPTQDENTDIVLRNDAGQTAPLGGTRGPGPFDPTEVGEHKIGTLNNGIPFYASGPAQAFQAPKSHAFFRGTTGSGNFIGAAYDTWGTYMVEMVPREQWTTFAPFRAPSVPATTRHFVNVVTDTNSRFDIEYRQGGSPPQPFPFNPDPLPGTDLIWGSVTVTAGATYIIEGANGATFSGFVYGNDPGYELYRPGGTLEDGDDDKSASAAGGDDVVAGILHPSEYEEIIGEMYGYPLAPSRCVLGDPDEYDVEVEQDCFEMTVRIKARNQNPLGLRFVRFDPNAENVNARIDWVEPTNPLELKEKLISEVEFKVVAIDPLRDAKATVMFRDRSRDGQIQRVEFDYEAERVVLDPADELDFGKLTLNESSGEREITVTNPLTRDVYVKNLDFVFGNQEFNIVRTDPPFDWTSDTDSLRLGPGETLRIYLEITPTQEINYADSLRIELGCVVVVLPVKAATVQPCLLVSDLDFGTLGTGVSKELELQLCNIGDGNVRFVDSSADGIGGAFLTWLLTEFSVTPADIAKLEATTLGPNDCVDIMVTFVSDTPGDFRDVARFWASTRECRDTSIWTARVVEPGPDIGSYDWMERWLSSDNDCTKNTEQNYAAKVPITNLDEATFLITDVKVVDDPDGVYSLDETAIATLRGQSVREDEVYEVDVFFTPLEEKDYSAAYDAKIRLYFNIPSTGTDDSIHNSLYGIGIESNVEITDADFGREQYSGPNGTMVTRPLTLTSTGTRAVTITNMTIGGADAADFENVTITTPGGHTVDATGNVAAPLVLAPGEEAIVNVTFNPQTVNPLLKNATLDLVGDFAYDNCSRTDSSGALTAEVFTLGAVIDNHDFGALLTCYEGDGVLTVQNTSTDQVLVTDVSPATPVDQYITVDPGFIVPAAGIMLEPAGQPGSSLEIPVHFAPALPGTYNADVTVTIMNIDRTETITTLVGQVAGVGRTIDIEFAIDDYPSRFPGLPLDDVVVNITGDDPAEANISDFRLTVRYDQGMMRLRNDPRLGSLFPATDGWELIEIERAPGYITVQIRNLSGNVVPGLGEALLLDFITFIGETTESELEPNGVILQAFGQNNNDCVNITYNPGNTLIDEVCGLDFRLIEAANARYAISDAQPSLIKTRTEISFSIGLEGQTTLEILDQTGNRVGLLVDQALTPGGYVVTWDAGGVSSGKYFIRAVSGPWTETLEVIVQK